MRNLERVPGVAAVAVVLLFVVGCSAQAKPAASVRMANPAEVKAGHPDAETSLLPAGARDVRFDDRQAVTVAGSPLLTVLPVSFKTPLKDPAVEGQMLSQCGVVVTPHGGAAKLLVTVGAGNTEMMSCTGVKAVGGTAAAAPGSRSDLILIYDAYTGRESFPATILLTWDAKAAAYAVDDALSQWLGEQKDGRTVAGARRLLAMKRQESHSNS